MQGKNLSPCTCSLHTHTHTHTHTVDRLCDSGVALGFSGLTAVLHSRRTENLREAVEGECPCYFRFKPWQNFPPLRWILPSVKATFPALSVTTWQLLPRLPVWLDPPDCPLRQLCRFGLHSDFSSKELSIDRAMQSCNSVEVVMDSSKNE